MALSPNETKLHNMIMDCAIALMHVRAGLYAIGAEKNPEAAKSLNESIKSLDSLLATAKELAGTNV